MKTTSQKKPNQEKDIRMKDYYYFEEWHDSHWSFEKSTRRHEGQFDEEGSIPEEEPCTFTYCTLKTPSITPDTIPEAPPILKEDSKIMPLDKRPA